METESDQEMVNVERRPYRDPDPFSIEAACHTFSFFPSGSDRRDQLIAFIDSAERSVQMFFYMFQADHAGTKVRGALIRAAQRGVDVHLITDAFGTDAPDHFFGPITRAGARYSSFSPRWNARYLIRNHQKFVVVDGERVMTGGANVSDHYFASPEENGWCDLAAMIEGPVVAKFAEWFELLEQWVLDGKTKFFAVRSAVRDWQEGEGPVRLVLGGPTKVTSAWARSVKVDIARSNRLDLVMAYFSPPRSMRRLIRRLAERGRARLIMAGKSDNGATIGASRALYRALIRSGAEIFEFEPCKLHMKLLVADDVTYFGSANFDMRSIRLNLELMLRVEHPALAERMRGLTDHMEAASTPVTWELHSKRSTIANRIRWRLGWFLVSVLDYTVTRRLNLGL